MLDINNSGKYSLIRKHNSEKDDVFERLHDLKCRICHISEGFFSRYKKQTFFATKINMKGTPRIHAT